MKVGKLAGIGLVVGMVVLTGCGDRGDEAKAKVGATDVQTGTTVGPDGSTFTFTYTPTPAPVTTTEAPAATTTSGSDVTYYFDAQGALSKLTQAGMNCIPSKYGVARKDRAGCNIDGADGKPVSMSVYPSTEKMQEAMTMRAGLIRMQTGAGIPSFFVVGGNWFVECTVFDYFAAKATCEQAGRALGAVSEPVLIASSGYQTPAPR